MVNARIRRYGWSKDIWYIVYAEGRRSRRVSTGTTDRVAAEEQLARWIEAKSKPTPSTIISEIVDGYLTDREHQKGWTDRQRQNHDAVFSPILKAFGQARTVDLGTARVRKYIADRRALGRQDATIDKELRMLRAALKWAVRQGWIDAAPYIETPGYGEPRDRWLTREEAQKLIDASEAPHIRLFILLALNTGARKNAILRLQWSDVDMEAGLIRFRPARHDSKKRAATVPISDTLMEALEEAKKYARTDHVIEYGKHNLVSIQRGWEKTLARSGIAHCTIHDLRRTCATWMVQAGIPTVRVARFLGDTEKMIERVYGHHSPDYLKDAAAVLGAQIARRGGGET